MFKDIRSGRTGNALLFVVRTRGWERKEISRTSDKNDYLLRDNFKKIVVTVSVTIVSIFL